MTTPGHLTILTVNLFNDRTNREAFERLIHTTRPDVVAAQELGPQGARVLERHYDHGLLRPETNYNGMGLAMSGPGEATEIDTPHPRAITADVVGDWWGKRGFRSLQLMSVRLPPPLTRTWVRMRRRYAETLLGHVGNHAGPHLSHGRPQRHASVACLSDAHPNSR